MTKECSDYVSIYNNPPILTRFLIVDIRYGISIPSLRRSTSSCIDRKQGYTSENSQETGTFEANTNKSQEHETVQSNHMEQFFVIHTHQNSIYPSKVRSYQDVSDYY